MTCPYHRRENGNPLCKYYGRVTEEKAQEECLGNYSRCLEKAREEEIRENRDREPEMDKLEIETFFSF